MCAGSMNDTLDALLVISSSNEWLKSLLDYLGGVHQA